MSDIPHRYQDLTLGEAIELFLTAKSGRKEATLRHYRDDLGRFASYIGLDTALVSIAPEDLDRYFAHRRGEGIQEITGTDINGLTIVSPIPQRVPGHSQGYEHQDGSYAGKHSSW